MVQKITSFKPGVMDGGSIATKRQDAEAERIKKLARAAQETRNAQEKALEGVPEHIKHALKKVLELPSTVVAQAIDIARKRYELEYGYKHTIKLNKHNLARIEDWLLSKQPNRDLRDDWIDVVEHPWPLADEWRLSLAIVVAQDRILSNEKAMRWTHFFDHATPYFGRRDESSGELVLTKKIDNNLPSVAFLKNLSDEEIKAREAAEREAFLEWERPIREQEEKEKALQQRFISATEKSNNPAAEPTKNPASEPHAATATATATATDDELIDPLSLLAGSDFLKHTQDDAEGDEDEQ